MDSSLSQGAAQPAAAVCTAHRVLLSCVTLSTPPRISRPAGCHYSSPGYVVYYLMRAHPQLMLRLQNGRFDAPDRLFWSVNDTWRSVTSLPTDVKELIPEFYSTDPTFLLNIEQIDFGCRASGEAWLKLLSSGLLLSSAQD